MEDMMGEWVQGREVEGTWARKEWGMEVSKGGNLDISTAREDETSNWMLLIQRKRGLVLRNMSKS
jgi:hypothetical protein